MANAQVLMSAMGRKQTKRGSAVRVVVTDCLKQSLDRQAKDPGNIYYLDKIQVALTGFIFGDELLALAQLCGKRCLAQVHVLARCSECLNEHELARIVKSSIDHPAR